MDIVQSINAFIEANPEDIVLTGDPIHDGRERTLVVNWSRFLDEFIYSISDKSESKEELTTAEKSRLLSVVPQDCGTLLLDELISDVGTIDGDCFLTNEEIDRIKLYQRGGLVLRLLQLKGNPFGPTSLFARDSQYIEGELQVKYEMAAVKARTGIELLQTVDDDAKRIDIQDPTDLFGQGLFAGRYDGFLVYLHRNLGVNKLSLSSVRRLCEDQYKIQAYDARVLRWYVNLVRRFSSQDSLVDFIDEWQIRKTVPVLDGTQEAAYLYIINHAECGDEVTALLWEPDHLVKRANLLKNIRIVFDSFGYCLGRYDFVYSLDVLENLTDEDWQLLLANKINLQTSIPLEQQKTMTGLFVSEMTEVLKTKQGGALFQQYLRSGINLLPGGLFLNRAEETFAKYHTTQMPERCAQVISASGRSQFCFSNNEELDAFLQILSDDEGVGFLIDGFQRHEPMWLSDVLEDMVSLSIIQTKVPLEILKSYWTLSGAIDRSKLSIKIFATDIYPSEEKKDFLVEAEKQGEIFIFPTPFSKDEFDVLWHFREAISSAGFGTYGSLFMKHLDVDSFFIFVLMKNCLRNGVEADKLVPSEDQLSRIEEILFCLSKVVIKDRENFLYWLFAHLPTFVFSKRTGYIFQRLYDENFFDTDEEIAAFLSDQEIYFSDTTNLYDILHSPTKTADLLDKIKDLYLFSKDGGKLPKDVLLFYAANMPEDVNLYQVVHDIRQATNSGGAPNVSDIAMFVYSKEDYNVLKDPEFQQFRQKLVTIPDLREKLLVSAEDLIWIVRIYQMGKRSREQLYRKHFLKNWQYLSKKINGNDRSLSWRAAYVLLKYPVRSDLLGDFDKFVDQNNKVSWAQHPADYFIDLYATYSVVNCCEEFKELYEKIVVDSKFGKEILEDEGISRTDEEAKWIRVPQCWSELPPYVRFKSVVANKMFYEDDQVREAVKRYLEKDIEDTTREYGGVLEYQQKKHRWILTAVPSVPGSNWSFSGVQDPLWIVSPFAFHQHTGYYGDEIYAGPGVRDILMTNETQKTNLIFTSINETQINVDLVCFDETRTSPMPYGWEIDLGLFEMGNSNSED